MDSLEEASERYEATIDELFLCIHKPESEFRSIIERLYKAVHIYKIALQVAGDTAVDDEKAELDFLQNNIVRRSASIIAAMMVHRYVWG